MFNDKKFIMGKEMVESININSEFVKPPNLINNSALKFEEIQKSITENKERERREELEYKESVLTALQGIEKNTALLTEMTFLLQKNNEKQEETFQLLIEILEIMKSINKTEAESKYRSVMKKIGDFSGDFETVKTLYGIGQLVYNAYQSIPL